MVKYEIPDNLKGVTVYTTKGVFKFEDDLSNKVKSLLYNEFNYPLVKIEIDEQKKSKQSEEGKGDKQPTKSEETD